MASFGGAGCNVRSHPLKPPRKRRMVERRPEQPVVQRWVVVERHSRVDRPVGEHERKERTRMPTDAVVIDDEVECNVREDIPRHVAQGHRRWRLRGRRSGCMTR